MVLFGSWLVLLLYKLIYNFCSHHLFVVCCCLYTMVCCCLYTLFFCNIIEVSIRISMVWFFLVVDLAVLLLVHLNLTHFPPNVLPSRSLHLPWFYRLLFPCNCSTDHSYTTSTIDWKALDCTCVCYSYW